MSHEAKGWSEPAVAPMVVYFQVDQHFWSLPVDRNGIS